MKKIIILCALFSTCAYGVDFKTARIKGLVGELTTGYISAVKKDGNADVAKIVLMINEKRKNKFKELASKTGAESIHSIGKSVYTKIIKKLPAGAYYKNANGSWVRK